MSKALLQTSIAEKLPFNNLFSVIIKHPDPVPMSKKLFFCLDSLIIQLTSSSVSGRGIKTELFTKKFKSKKHASSKIY